MTTYFNDVWRCRYFLGSLVRADLRTRYRRSLLGMGWSLLHPIAMTATICLVFHQIFNISVRDFAPYLLAGLACWTYIVTTTLQGCQSLYMGEAYIRQFPAPLAIYPLRTALGSTVHFLIALFVVTGMMIIFKGGSLRLLPLLTLAPSLVLLCILGWSLATLAGFANVFIQDTQHLCEIGFQVLFYATPIMWKPSMLDNHRLAWILHCNPLVPILTLIRDPLVDGVFPSLSTYAAALGTVSFFVALATLVLVRFQKTLIFYL